MGPCIACAHQKTPANNEISRYRYMDEVGNFFECKVQTTTKCGLGEFITGDPATSLTKRVECKPCPDNTYMDQATHTFQECIDQPTCDEVHSYPISSSPTDRRVCEQCQCSPHGTCIVEQNESNGIRKGTFKGCTCNENYHGDRCEVRCEHHWDGSACDSSTTARATSTPPLGTFKCFEAGAAWGDGLLPGIHIGVWYADKSQNTLANCKQVVGALQDAGGPQFECCDRGDGWSHDCNPKEENEETIILGQATDVLCQSLVAALGGYDAGWECDGRDIYSPCSRCGNELAQCQGKIAEYNALLSTATTPPTANPAEGSSNPPTTTRATTAPARAGRAVYTIEKWESRLGEAGKLPDGPRVGFGMVHLPSATAGNQGTVMVAGGYRDGPLDSVHFFDLDTGKWRNPPAKLPGGQRYYFGMVHFPSAANGDQGTVMVAGGHGKEGLFDLDSVYLFDVEAETWRSAAPLPGGGRWDFGMVYVPSASSGGCGTVVIAGGVDSDWRDAGELDSVYKYDIATDEWSYVATLPDGGRTGVRIAHIPSTRGDGGPGAVMIAGGHHTTNYRIDKKGYSVDSVYTLDLGTASWSVAAPMPGGTRTLFGMLHVPSASGKGRGMVIIAGGYRYDYGSLSSVYMFDVDAGSWGGPAAPLPDGGLNNQGMVYIPSAHGGHQGTIMIAGGTCSGQGCNGVSDSVYFSVPETITSTSTTTTTTTTTVAVSTATTMITTPCIPSSGGYKKLGNGICARGGAIDWTADRETVGGRNDCQGDCNNRLDCIAYQISSSGNCCLFTGGAAPTDATGSGSCFLRLPAVTCPGFLATAVTAATNTISVASIIGTADGFTASTTAAAATANSSGSSSNDNSNNADGEEEVGQRNTVAVKVVPALVVVLAAALALGWIYCPRNAGPTPPGQANAWQEEEENTIPMANNPMQRHANTVTTVQTPTFMGRQLCTEPESGQPAIYDQKAAERVRSVSIQQQSNATGSSVLYAIPIDPGNGDAYVDDGFYAQAGGGVMAPVAPGAYVDDGYYAETGAAGGGSARSAGIVYSVPVVDAEA